MADNNPTWKKTGSNDRNTKKNNLISDVAGRIVPRDIEVESAVLGALMLETNAFSEVCDIIHPESFYEPAHTLIYEAIMNLGAEQKPIDMLTVIDKLKFNGTLDKVGGAPYIVQLTSNIASAAHVEFHARILAQKHLARELIRFASEIENNAFDESIDVDDILQQAESRIFELSQRNVKKEVMQIDPILDDALKQIEIAANRTSGLSGLETGFTELDKITAGWQNSDLIIIAARPAMGKTAFVLSMAKNMAVNLNTAIGFFSLEMSNMQLVNRLIQNICEIDGAKIKTGQLTQLDWDKLTSRVSMLRGAPLYIDDTPSLSILELQTKARRLVAEKGVRMIIIDYLQLMNASGMRFGSREQEVSMISRSLKQLAKELNIPIIALSQLNRSVESRTNDNKRPQLSDLRESGAIEQDADMVCFIHRPEYYLKTTHDANNKDIRGKAEFIIAKHRSGAVGDVDMRFRGVYARFENWTPEVGDSDGAFTRQASKFNDDTELPGDTIHEASEAASSFVTQNTPQPSAQDFLQRPPEEEYPF